MMKQNESELTNSNFTIQPNEASNCFWIPFVFVTLQLPLYDLLIFVDLNQLTVV